MKTNWPDQLQNFFKLWTSKKTIKKTKYFSENLSDTYSLNGEPETRSSSRPSVTKEEPNPKNEVHEQQANRRHQTLSHFDISFMLGYSWSSNTSARLYPI